MSIGEDKDGEHGGLWESVGKVWCKWLAGPKYKDVNDARAERSGYFLKL